MDIESLFDYSDNCRELLAETLRGCPDELHRPFETISNFKSVAQLFAHIIAAEERWIVWRLQQLPLPVMYEARAATTLEGLVADAVQMRVQTRALIATLTEDDRKRIVIVNVASAPKPLHLTIEQILFQIINHENYHRGQIITALQRQGIDPPNFDYALLQG